MTATGRVGLGAVCAVAAGLVLATLFADGWFHAPYSQGNPEIDWDGFGGPYLQDDVLLRRVVTPVAAIGSFGGALCGLLLAFGTIAGQRRDHVPRLPGMLAVVSGGLGLVLQAASIPMWKVDAQPTPHGYGWALPVYFVGAIGLVAAALLLWRDARRRAHASADALAVVEREQAARDAAGLPGDGSVPEPPVERI